MPVDPSDSSSWGAFRPESRVWPWFGESLSNTRQQGRRRPLNDGDEVWVGKSSERGDVLNAYRKYLDHVMTCATCVDHSSLCAIGKALHRAYRAAADSGVWGAL